MSRPGEVNGRDMVIENLLCDSLRVNGDVLLLGLSVCGRVTV